MQKLPPDTWNVPKTVPFVSPVDSAPSPVESAASPWMGAVYGLAMSGLLFGAFVVATASPWSLPWDTASVSAPPPKKNPSTTQRRIAPDRAQVPVRSLDARSLEQDLQSLTPAQRAVLEEALGRLSQAESATDPFSDAQRPGFERTEGGAVVGVNGWDDRPQDGAHGGAMAPSVARTAPFLAAPPLADPAPEVDTSSPPPPPQLREGMVRLIEEFYAAAHPGDPVPPDGLVDRWIGDHPLGVSLSYGAPDAWSARRGFGVDTTGTPPAFVFPDGMVWSESVPGFWDIEGHVRPAFDGLLLWAVHNRGRSGHSILQMALVEGRLRILGSDLGRSEIPERDWPVQEVPVVGWSPLFQDGRSVAQTVLVAPGGVWLVRVVSPETGATAFLRVDPEGRTPPVATGVVFQAFAVLDAWSSTWKTPEEAWRHLPETLATMWNIPANWPPELGHLLAEQESGTDPFADGRLAFASGSTTSPAWALGVGVLATEHGTRGPSSTDASEVDPFFAPEVSLNRVPAITGFPGGDAVAMWIPRGAQEPYAWVAGVDEGHVLEGKPLPELRRMAFTIPQGTGLADILRIEHAHVWADGAALLKAELVDGRLVNLLWHMPSGAVAVLGG